MDILVYFIFVVAMCVQYKVLSLGVTCGYAEHDFVSSNNKGLLTIDCHEDDLSTTLQKIRNCDVNPAPTITAVEIGRCTSVTPYAEALKNNNLNIGAIKNLSVLLPVLPRLNKTLFQGLLILSLRIRPLIMYNSLQPEDDFLENNTATELDVDHMILPPFPESSKIRKAILRNGKSKDFIGYCSALTDLEIIDWEVVVGNWLQNCHNLTTLKLNSLSKPVIKRVLGRAFGLLSLTIKECRLDCLNYETSDCSTLLQDNTKLKYLDLSHNDLKVVPESALENLNELVELNLSHNSIIQFCGLDDELNLPPSLQILHLQHTSEFRPCKTIPDKLEYLNWSENIKYDLPLVSIVEYFNHRTPLIINMKGSKVMDVSVIDYDTLELYKEFRENLTENPKTLRPNITIQIDPFEINCQCHHYWSAKILNETPGLKIECSDDSNACIKCTDGRRLDEMPLGALECDDFSCAENCECRTWWADGAVNAFCQGRTEIPRVKNLETLAIRGNQIQTIFADDLPETLYDLDLSDNRITHIDAYTTEVMFSIDRTVLLSGNPLACDCDNQVLLTYLKEYRNQVLDFENITCNGALLSDVDVTYLCDPENRQKQLVTALGVSIALAVLAITSLAFYYRYRTVIKVYLHKRGFCLCLFQDQEEKDCNFDAFVSFSHEDEAFVMDELIPGLEQEPRKYTVCVHYRNWIAGEWIPMQIARSVQQSRRTLVVLSSSFLNSMWGLLEFRTAMMCSAKDEQPKVIIILLDEAIVKNEHLDPQLRVYLSSNTYLCWGDPWFWDKLRYALPHRKRHKPFKKSLDNNAIELPTLQIESTGG